MRRGRQNFEIKLFGCINVPNVCQINVRWWGKNISGYKKLQGSPRSFRGAKKLQGSQEAYKKNRKNSGDLFSFFFSFFLGDSKKFVFCRGAKNFSRGRRKVNMVNVTPLRRPTYSKNVNYCVSGPSLTKKNILLLF